MEWESKKAQSFEELTAILVSDLKYHQLDILDAFQEADPERFVASDGLRSAAEPALQTKSTDENIEKAKGLIDGWLKNIKKGS